MEMEEFEGSVTTRDLGTIKYKLRYLVSRPNIYFMSVEEIYPGLSHEEFMRRIIYWYFSLLFEAIELSVIKAFKMGISRFYITGAKDIKYLVKLEAA
jgi:hypothetical protein